MTGSMRQALHIVVGIAFWTLLAALWVLLACQGKTSGAALRDTGATLAVLMGVVLTVTIWWIRHNVSIYRRKGARTERPLNPPRTNEDRLGRQVVWELPGGAAGAATQRDLVVELAGGIKTYRPEA
ncbi:MAG TPA: hypothetical protein VF257_15835 [Solirubrobacteraceae bacterium]